jgi:hypothetical protein
MGVSVRGKALNLILATDTFRAPGSTQCVLIQRDT